MTFREHRTLVARILLLNFVALLGCLCMASVVVLPGPSALLRSYHSEEVIHTRLCVAVVPPRQEERVPTVEVYYQNDFSFRGAAGYFYPPGYVIIADNVPCD